MFLWTMISLTRVRRLWKKFGMSPAVSREPWICFLLVCVNRWCVYVCVCKVYVCVRVKVDIFRWAWIGVESIPLYHTHFSSSVFTVVVAWKFVSLSLCHYRSDEYIIKEANYYTSCIILFRFSIIVVPFDSYFLSFFSSLITCTSKFLF